MSDNKDFGLFLKEELTKKTNLNVSQVASILKCSRSTLNDLFNGKRQLSKAFAKRTEEAFSSNSLSSSYSIKADSLLKKQAALIYGISEDHSSLKDATNTSSSLGRNNRERSSEASDDKYTLSNNTSSIQDQGIPFFVKITREKIESYVDNNHQECRGLIPEFVYTLIATTASKDYLEKFYLPYGDDISLKGFDGIVIYNQNHPYIPKGYSVWEIGTNKDPKRKFDEDFSKAKEKLSKSSPSTDIHDVTYVAVFPRTISYENQEKWIRQKKKDGSEFKDIRIIDAFLLAQWANQSVSAQLHFSKQFSNVTDNDILTNIETSQFMYKEMSFNNIANGEELLDNLFSLYKNDYYGLFSCFIRDGLGSNILNAASESKSLTKAFICYLAKLYDSEDQNNSTDNNVNGIEYPVKASLRDPDDDPNQKDLDFDGYQQSRYTNLFLNTYYIKDYALLAKLILALKVLSILIVDEEIIDDRIKGLCKENKNVRIVAIRNSYPFDILNSKGRKPSLVEELGMEEFFANSSKPVEEIELQPLPPFQIEDTLNKFISYYFSNNSHSHNAVSSGNHPNDNYLDLKKLSQEKRRTVSYLSEGSILNLKEILSNNDEVSSSRPFIQQLKEQDINLNFLFCFCLMGRVNLDAEDKFDVTVLKELLKDVVTPDTDIETELNKIVNLKLHKGIARFHNRCYFATSRYITLNHLYKNSTLNKKTIISNLYATVISLLKIKTRNGFITSMFLDKNEFEAPLATSVFSDLSSVNEYNSLRGCKGLNEEFNGHFRDYNVDRNNVSFLDYGNIRLDKEEKSLRKNIKDTYRNLVDNILENFELRNYNLPLTAQYLSYDLSVTDGYTQLLKKLLDAICFFTKTNDMNVELKTYKYSSYLFRELNLDLLAMVGSKQEHSLIQKELSVHENNSLYDNFFKSYLQLIGIAKCSEQLTVIDKDYYLSFIQNEVPYFIGKAKEKDIYNCFIEDHPLYYSSVLYSILYIAKTSCNSDFSKTDFKKALKLLLILKDSDNVFNHRNAITPVNEVLDEIFYVCSFKNEKDVNVRCNVLKDNLKLYPDTCKDLLQREIYKSIHGFPHHIRPSSAWIGVAKRYSVSYKLFEYTINSLLSVYLEIVNMPLFIAKSTETKDDISKYSNSSNKSKSNRNVILESGQTSASVTQISASYSQSSTSAEYNNRSSQDRSALHGSSLSDDNNLSLVGSEYDDCSNLYDVSSKCDSNSAYDCCSEANNKKLVKSVERIVTIDDLRTILYCVPFLTQDNLNAVLDLVKISATSASDDYKFELLNLFAKEESKVKKEFDKLLNSHIKAHKESNNNNNKNKSENDNEEGEEEESENKQESQYLRELKNKIKVLENFFEYVKKVLEIKSTYLKHKWLIESCNTPKYIHEYEVPLEILEKYQDKDEDELYNYLSKLKTDYLFKVLKLDGPKAISWILQNCKNTFDLGKFLLSVPKLSVDHRYNLFSFFIEELFLKNDKLKLNSFQDYLRNIENLFDDLSSVDDGFMLTRAYHDFAEKKKLSATQMTSILLNLPCIEVVFNLADENCITSDLYWKQVYINNPFSLCKNRKLVNRIQVSFTKVKRLIDFVFYFRFYFEFDTHNSKTDLYTVKLATDCIREIVKELNSLYTKEYLKGALSSNSKDKAKLQTLHQTKLLPQMSNQTSAQVSQQAQHGYKNALLGTQNSDKEDMNINKSNVSVTDNRSDNGIRAYDIQEIFNRGKYAIKSSERKQYFSSISNTVHCLSLDSDVFKKFLKIILSQGDLSFNEKVIVELFVLPYVHGSIRNSEEKEEITKEINQYFSVNPSIFFRFFCQDFMQNYYEGIDNKTKLDAKHDIKSGKAFNSDNKTNCNSIGLNITCLYFTDYIYEEISPVPGFCSGQKPDSKEIEAWVNDILMAAQNTQNYDIIFSTNHRLANILAKQKNEGNNLIPAIEICKAIENIDNEEFISEFECACFNDYSLSHVGFIDREGVAYKNKAIKFDNLLHKIDRDMYPRTFRIVKNIRDTYLNSSRREAESHLLNLYNS